MSTSVIDWERVAKENSLPNAPACLRNQKPILEHLEPLFHKFAVRSVLEIGSGTGQHAAFFCHEIPGLTWQTGDLKNYHEGIKQWIDFASRTAGSESKILLPVDTNSTIEAWDVGCFDAVFSANTFHIMGWENVKEIFEHLKSHLHKDSVFCYYGPFNYNGKYTSESNANFDIWLKDRDPKSAIRSFEEVNSLAEGIGLVLLKDNPMPANNRLVFWKMGTQ